MLRKLWRQAHWLIGISVGIVLALIAVTGAMLAFETSILQWLNADARTVTPQGERLSPPQVLERIETQSSGGQVTSLRMFTNSSSAVRVVFDAASSEPIRYLNPYTAQWLDGGTRGEKVFKATRALHRWLMVAGVGDRDIGRQVVGVCTLLLVVLLLSGLYLRWPRGRRTWRTWLLFDGRLKGRGFIWSMHAVAGTYVLPVYLFLALTGLYWSFDWYRNALFALTGTPSPAAYAPLAQSADDESDMHAVWARFEKETVGQDIDSVILYLPTAPAQPVEIRYLNKNAAHDRELSTLLVDPMTARVIRHERHAERSSGAKAMVSMYALHTGSFFGVVATAVFMLASLAMPFFAVTGWLMYLKRRGATARSRK